MLCFSPHRPCLLQLVHLIFIGPQSHVEAAALGHLHVHGAEVLLAVLLPLAPQCPKAAKRQPPWLRGENITSPMLVKMRGVTTGGKWCHHAAYLDFGCGGE